MESDVADKEDHVTCFYVEDIARAMSFYMLFILPGVAESSAQIHLWSFLLTWGQC